MVSARAAGVRARLASLVAVLGLLLGGLVGAPPASAAEPVALVSITLNSIDPAVPERDGEITLTGTVKNITDQPLLRLKAIFWRNQAPITDREGFDQALVSESNDPLGTRKVEVFQELFTVADPALDPGETADFTLTARVADLELAPTDGVYLMGVHVLQAGNLFAVGRARTFVPLVTEDVPEPLQLSTLVVLSSRPSLVREGVLSDEHLAREIGPKGRLTQLLKAADRDGTSFAIDPALITELQTMQGGYEVLAGDGGTAPGAGQTDATRWLEDFLAMKSERNGYRLLYGSPDIAALVRDGQESVLTSAETANRLVPTTSALPLLVMPTGGLANADTVEAAADLEPTAIVLSDSTVRSGAPLLAGPDDTPIVAFGTTAAEGGPGPDPRDTPVHVQQRSVSEAWIEATTVSSDESARGRVRVVRTAAQARAEAAEVAVPWTKRSTLGELLKGRPAKWEQRYRYTAEARAAELTAGQLGSLRRFAKSQQVYADLLVEADKTELAGDAAVARAASGAWRKRNTRRMAFLAPQQAELDDLLMNKLEIRSNSKVSTFAREGVVFPITIRNNLPASSSDPNVNAVHLRLIFISDNRSRLTIKPIEAELIRAEDGYTDNAEVTAKANGIVPVTAQLQTMEGDNVGQPFRIDVRVTQNGTTGWVIAIAAGLVLIGTTTLRIRTVARERARAQAAAPEETVGAMSSAPAIDEAPVEQLAERDV